jgi:hypothetical protein
MAMVRRRPVGGMCIRQPSSDIIVIFIHGILSDGEQAWMNAAGKTWPRLLADEASLEQVGIFSFSFRSDLFSKNYSVGDIVDSIREFFNLDDLWDYKKIVFVCHSMGASPPAGLLS